MSSISSSLYSKFCVPSGEGPKAEAHIEKGKLILHCSVTEVSEA